MEVAEQDRHKTAFSTPMGLFEANRMPFGLQYALSTFQRLMTCCFGDLNFTHLLIYLDDLIIFSKTFDEHLERLQLVFDRLREHGLKLKPSKCWLVREEVQYLGHLVSKRASGQTRRRSAGSRSGRGLPTGEKCCSFWDLLDTTGGMCRATPP